MSRVAILPALDDGFGIAYWLRNFAAIWQAEVDRVVILITGRDSDAIAIDHPKVTVLRQPQPISAGMALERLVAATDEDHLLFCEDDAYVRRPGVIDEAFRAVESGAWDVHGSPREMASRELLDVSRDRWGTASAGVDNGNALWPAFLVISRDILGRTNGQIEPTLWKRGDVVPGLHHTVVGETASDETFVATTWQLRDIEARILLVPQYRAADEPHIGHAAEAPWFHVGSLSSGQGFYRGETTYQADHAAAHPDEAARRISWWMRWALSSPPSPRRDRYVELVSAFRDAARISAERVDHWRRLYDPLVTWPET